MLPTKVCITQTKHLHLFIYKFKLFTVVAMTRRNIFSIRLYSTGSPGVVGAVLKVGW